jgi:hypothetical protein
MTAALSSVDGDGDGNGDGKLVDAYVRPAPACSETAWSSTWQPQG